MDWFGYLMAAAFVLFWVVLLYKFLKVTRKKNDE